MSIMVKCTTNLDDLKTQKWPTELTCRPMVGDYVKSEGGYRLKIRSITHGTYKAGPQEVVGGRERRPRLELYLDRWA